MKTPKQILNDNTPPGAGYHISWIIKAMKAYTIQYIERLVSEIGLPESDYSGEIIHRKLRELKDEIQNS